MIVNGRSKKTEIAAEVSGVSQTDILATLDLYIEGLY